MVRKGGGPARPPEGGRQAGPPHQQRQRIRLYGVFFAKKEAERERQVQCRQASGASKRAGRKYVCEAIMQIVRPRNIFDAAVSDG